MILWSRLFFEPTHAFPSMNSVYMAKLRLISQGSVTTVLRRDGLKYIR